MDLPYLHEEVGKVPELAGQTIAGRHRAEPQEPYDEPDLVRYYLDEIGATPLLSAEEEVDLAKRIEAGVYAYRLLEEADAGETRLPAKRRRELQALAADGDLAKDHMIRANLRLVVSVAKKHTGRGVPFLDVIQERNLGLIRAVEKFDYAKGYKFSTDAMWWIRQAIQRGMAEQARTVRLPVHVMEDLAKIGRVERKLRRDLSRDPTSEEIAAEVDLPVERIDQLRKAAAQPVSLDTPVGQDGTRIGDLIEDADVAQAQNMLEFRALAEELRSLVDTLPPREAMIISLRYGLHDGQPHTLQEIGDRLGLTRERIRQLDKEAMAQLRNPERRQTLLAWAG